MAKKKEEGNTEMETTPRRELASLDMNYFESYGNQVSQRNIRGQLLKFSKGDWLAGQDDEEIAEGTQFVANMDQLLIGWVKWVENKPDQQIMGLLTEGHKAPQRDELGDTDEALWEVGSDGQSRDPWQFTNYLIMKRVGVANPADDDLYTFTSSSRGGLNCIGDLCKVYGKQMRMRPDEWPIVEVGSSSYKHPNPEFGRIKIPTMTVVGWEKKELFEEQKNAA